MSEVAVLGLGNVLMRDDAFGPHVVHALETGWTFPEGVEVSELGTPGFDLVPHLSGRRVVILIDTVSSDAPPGSLKVYRRDALVGATLSARGSAHEPTVLATLQSLEFSGGGPEEVVLVGVVPRRTDKGTELSPEVSSAVPSACDAVLDELSRLGVRAERRESPVASPVWWETA